MNKLVLYLVVVTVILMAFLSGYTGLFVGPGGSEDMQTFTDSGATAAYVDGKPVIRLYSTTWCPHCNWVGPTFDSVVKEYVAEGKIIAYHWELDTGDNTLTDEVESSVPLSEMQVYEQFNPRGTIPTFVFGGKYYRIGTGYEKQGDLLAEEREFRAVIDSLLK